MKSKGFVSTYSLVNPTANNNQAKAVQVLTRISNEEEPTEKEMVDILFGVRLSNEVMGQERKISLMPRDFEIKPFLLRNQRLLVHGVSLHPETAVMLLAALQDSLQKAGLIE